MTINDILLPHPLFSMFIISVAKKAKMIQTVANTHLFGKYIKKIEEVIEIYQNYRVIKYSFNSLGLLMRS